MAAYKPNPKIYVISHLELVLTNRHGESVGRVKIDQCDYDFVKPYRWSLDSVGYAYNFAVGRMHRFLLKAEKGQLVDHVSFDKLDNRRANLRLVTPSQNLHHRPAPCTNKSGYVGVCWDNTKKRWRATVAGKNMGYFRNIEEAVAARDAGALRLFGEYAMLNRQH